MYLHLSFFKRTMAFLEIAFNNGGVLRDCVSWRAMFLHLSCLKAYDGVLRDCV